MITRTLFSRGISLLGLSCLLGLSLASAPAEAKSASSQDRSGVRLTATIWGVFREATATEIAEGSFAGPCWRGNALVQIGTSEPMLAKFVDVSAGPPVALDNGALTGGETITFDFGDGNSFQVVATFTGYPGATPMIYTLDEVGTIINGKGEFKGMTGSVSVKGPFVFPLVAIGKGDAPPGWVAQMKGKVRLATTE